MSTYKVTLSREDPWWVATASGPGLPVHGAVTESRTIAGLEDNIRDLIVLRTDTDQHMPYDDAVRALDLEWSYSLPDDAAKVLRDYLESKQNLAAGQEQYAAASQQAVQVLHVQAHAPVRDIARLMDISFQRVHQILAELRAGLRSRGLTGRR